jgi:hypothetical protein
MDLKSFASTADNYDKKENTDTQSEAIHSGMSENDIHRAVNHYGKMSDDQLMHELLKHMSAQKAKGKGTDMMHTIARIKPLLNKQQQQKLDSILTQMNM